SQSVPRSSRRLPRRLPRRASSRTRTSPRATRRTPSPPSQRRPSASAATPRRSSTPVRCHRRRAIPTAARRRVPAQRRPARRSGPGAPRTPPLRVKDFSESDIHVDPTNPRHVIAVSKWFVYSEGYNHLAGFYESYDGGATWPQQGHIPGYEGWTDNSDPVGAFDPWGNFYAVVLPYMFRYLVTGEHFTYAPDVNPEQARGGLGVAVRPRGATTSASWIVNHNGSLDMVRRAPFAGALVFDKQWIAIDRNPRSKHFGRVYV